MDSLDLLRALLALPVLAGVLGSMARDRAWLRMEYPLVPTALAGATLVGT